MPLQNQDLAQLRALNRRFIHNFVTNDVAGHDAILHPEFIEIGTSGACQNRASYLREWATGFDPEVISYWDMRDEHISVLGDLALVRAVTKWVRRADGAAVAGMTRYTDVYLRTGDRWLCVQAQLTPVAERNYPDDSGIVCRYFDGILAEGS